MRLVIDSVGNKSGGGICVLLDVLKSAAANKQIHEITVLASPSAVRQFDFPACEKLTVIERRAADTPMGRVLWAWQGLDQWLQKQRYDAFLGLNGFGPVRGRRPFLIFIQQSVPYSYEALRRFPVVARLRMKVIRRLTYRSANAADFVLVQSEVMRATIARAFHLSLDRIAAYIPSPSELPRSLQQSSKIDAMRSCPLDRVLLYVGSDAPHKNLKVVAQGLRKFKDADRPKWFVTVPANSPLSRDGTATPLGALSRNELGEAYQSATLLVMPSLTETVGLPMLEAMSLGIPVLAADRPYAREMCEDAAMFFDPLAPDDFFAKTKLLLADAERRAELSKRGLALVKRRNMIDTYGAIMEKVIEIVERQAKKSPR